MIEPQKSSKFLNETETWMTKGKLNYKVTRVNLSNI